ncbi:MAG: thiamine-phosphate kinase [Chloroflexota bacterium]|nr:thiamine-phosphate kinase [Chloroflexota bacterium]
MLVRELGEFRLIELLAETLAAEGVDGPDFTGDDLQSPHLGIGDDAAAWEGEAGTRVLTTDTMVEGVHFSLDMTGWRDLGWKAMAVNLSDVAAMGCVPTCSVVTLGLRDDLPAEGLVEMYRGMAEACRRHGGRVVGGDIVGSPVLFVSVAMEGEAKVLGPGGGGAILKRGAADVGDVIAVTGNLGDSAGGFHMAMEGEPYDDSTDRLRTAHFRPEPRLATGQALAKAGIRAAMDISDGLVGDLTKLCEASGVGAVVRGNEVPVSEALRLQFPDRWLSLALTGGEDYELLFTGREETVREVTDTVDVPVTVIGEIVDASRGVSVEDAKGDAIDTERGGWDHFANGPDGG